MSTLTVSKFLALVLASNPRIDESRIYSATDAAGNSNHGILTAQTRLNEGLKKTGSTDEYVIVEFVPGELRQVSREEIQKAPKSASKNTENLTPEQIKAKRIAQVEKMLKTMQEKDAAEFVKKAEAPAAPVTDAEFPASTEGSAE